MLRSGACTLLAARAPRRCLRIVGALAPQQRRSVPQTRGSALATQQCPGQQQLRHNVPASSKPHLAEKSTAVWLAIWRIWAGFANSQLWRATFRSTYLYMCPSPLLPSWTAAQTDANLSAHLHRLPTPSPYLRRMGLSHGRVHRYWVPEVAAVWLGIRVLGAG